MVITTLGCVLSIIKMRVIEFSRAYNALHLFSIFIISINYHQFLAYSYILKSITGLFISLLSSIEFECQVIMALTLFANALCFN